MYSNLHDIDWVRKMLILFTVKVNSMVTFLVFTGCKTIVNIHCHNHCSKGDNLLTTDQSTKTLTAPSSTDEIASLQHFKNDHSLFLIKRTLRCHNYDEGSVANKEVSVDILYHIFSRLEEESKITLGTSTYIFSVTA